jgi:hypothetical protein
MIKEQIEWLIEHKYMKRDEDNINMFIYMAWKDLKKKLQQTSAKNIEAWAWIQAGQIFCAVLPCLKKSISLSAAAKKSLIRCEQTYTKLLQHPVHSVTFYARLLFR